MKPVLYERVKDCTSAFLAMFNQCPIAKQGYDSVHNIHIDYSAVKRALTCATCVIY